MDWDRNNIFTSDLIDSFARKRQRDRIALSKKGQQLARSKTLPTLDWTSIKLPLCEGACEKCTPVSNNHAAHELDKYKPLKIWPEKDHQSWIDVISKWLMPTTSSKDQGGEKQEGIDFDTLTSTVLQDETVLKTFQEKNLEQVSEMVTEMVAEMKPKISTLETTLSSIAPGGVIYHSGQIEMLKERPGSHFLFVPIFNDPNDVFVIKAILLAGKVSQSVVVATAENPSIHADLLLQNDLDDYPRFILQMSTIIALFQAKRNFIFQLQEAKSVGSIMSLLYGLDYFMDPINNKVLQDVHVVPTNVTYEYPDGKSSRARVSFDQPFSLSEFMNHSPFPDSVFKVCLAEHILTTAQVSSKITCTEILAFILTYFDTSEWTFDGLLEAFSNVKDNIMMKAGDFSFHGNDKACLCRALHLLNISQNATNGRFAVREASMLTGLQFHAENVCNFYFGESAVLTSILSLLKLTQDLASMKSANFVMPQASTTDITDAASILIHLLTGRFHAKYPCSDMHNFVQNEIARLKAEMILLNMSEKKNQTSEHLQDRVARRLARNLDMDLADSDEERERVKEVYLTLSLESESVSQTLRLLPIIKNHISIFYETIKMLQKKVELDEECVQIQEVITALSDTNPFKETLVHACLNKLEEMDVIRPDVSTNSAKILSNQETLLELRQVIKHFVL